LDKQNEQTSEDDHDVHGSKPGTEELQRKVEMLKQRLAESSRHEQELSDRVHELLDNKDMLEQKTQQMEKLLAKDETGWLQGVSCCYSFKGFHCAYHTEEIS